MDTREEQPLAPVHVAELVVSPHDVEVSLGVCLGNDCYQPLAEHFDIGQQLLPGGAGWSLFKRIIYVGRLLTMLNNAANRAFVDGCDGTNMRQDIGSGPLSLLWSCVKGSIGDGSGRCQKLAMRFLQRFDELLRGTTHGLACQITTNAGNLF